jgi:hypothetical protein
LEFEGPRGEVIREGPDEVTVTLREAARPLESARTVMIEMSLEETRNLVEELQAALAPSEARVVRQRVGHYPNRSRSTAAIIS